MTSRLPLRTILAALFAAVALLLTTASLPATAASTGSVKGVVSVAGKPLASAKVQLFRNIDSDPGGDGDSGRVTRLKTVFTGKNGKYSFSGLKSKKDPKYGLETYQYFVLATDRSGATVRRSLPVKVKKGKTVTKNIALSPAAILTGKVVRSDGRSPEGMTVKASTDATRPDRGYNPELLPNHETTVSARGTFKLGGLEPGHYDHLAIGGGRYEVQCVDFSAAAMAPCEPTTAPLSFTVVAGERRGVAPVTLTSLLSTLTGTVTDTDGKPLKGIEARVYSGGDGVPTSVGKTRSTGRFAAKGVPTGSYTVRFYDPSRTWATQYATRGTTRSEATVYQVVGGRNRAGISVKLKSSARVKASVKAGSGWAKLTFLVSRKASGGRPSGTITVAAGTSSRSVKLVKGKATIKLTGLPKGAQKLVATYSGTSSTQGVTKTYAVTVK